jgi:hypothetical protein
LREKSAILIPPWGGNNQTQAYISQKLVAQSTIFIFFTIYYLKERANKLYGGTYYMGKYGS